MAHFSIEELQQLIANQCSMYGLLAHLYRVEVSQELLNEMKKMDLGQQIDYPQIDDAYRLLSGFLAQLTKITTTDLAVEYARIFLGAGLEPGTGAYPFESVYTSERRLLMQDARDQVQQLYHQAGVSVADEVTEPEDHLGFELEFMAHLGQQVVQALTDGDMESAAVSMKKQKDFLENHLLPWVPNFCADVERIAETDFYVAVARITLGYLALSHELTGELMSAVENERVSVG